MDAIQERVISEIRKQGFVSDETVVNPESNLHDLQFDSLDLAELAMGLEEHFDIELEFSDVCAATTVGEVIDLVRKEMTADVGG